jgi:hypothetical protein
MHEKDSDSGRTMDLRKPFGRQSKSCEKDTYVQLLNKHMIRDKIPIDPDYEWNYLFLKWMTLWVEYEDDWYTMANIDYEVLVDS